jgi:hypothetical protein
MSVPSSTAEHYNAQKKLSVATLAKVRALWNQIRPADFDASWSGIGPKIQLILELAQRQAAAAGTAYIDAVVAELGISAPLEAPVSTVGLVNVASSGYDLGGVLYDSIITAKEAVMIGQTGRQALKTARSMMDGIVLTQVTDAGRVAAGLSVVARPRIKGYVRMLNPPSCSRCVVLAGKFYKWNAGFERHPRCDCRHIPVQEDMAAEYRTDPKAYFDSLTPEQQDAAFTKAGAQAIRDGADISQVVNVRRGAAGLTPAGARITKDEASMLRNGLERGRLSTTDVYGRDLYTTSEGTTSRGVAGRQLITRSGATTETTRSASRAVTRHRARAPRLMPESIYQIATSRDDALRLLKLNGYLL